MDGISYFQIVEFCQHAFQQNREIKRNSHLLAGFICPSVGRVGARARTGWKLCCSDLLGSSRSASLISLISRVYSPLTALGVKLPSDVIHSECPSCDRAETLRGAIEDTALRLV